MKCETSFTNKHFTFQVVLEGVELTLDYSLYLNWKITLLDNYYCDALFIYQETATSEVFIDYVPVSSPTNTLHESR